VYLPKHTSWFNQIEAVFGIVLRRAMRRGNFQSVEALRELLLDFTDDFHGTFAQPFRWTCAGRPLATEADPKARYVEGKMGKPPRIWRTFRSGGLTLATGGTSASVPVPLLPVIGRTR
jgi:hypothetical protein